ncbi:hypothetical protein V8D89_004524 [Ganoderma adspersum]
MNIWRVAFVWPTHWSAMKFLFITNKYMALGDALFEAAGYSRFMRLSNDKCSILFQVYCYWYTTGTIFSEFILLVRTIALWGFNRYLITFIALAAIQLIPETYYCVYNWVSFLEFTSRSSTFGCFTGVESQDAWLPFFIFVCVEIFVVALTLINRFRHHNFTGSTGSRMIQTLYRDGTTFWMIVLVFFMSNLVVMIQAPVEMSNCMHPLVRAVHSALCTRVLLNLRKAAAYQCPTTGNREFTLPTTLVFNQQFLRSGEYSSPGTGELNGNAGGGDQLELAEDNFLGDGEGAAGIDSEGVQAEA